MNPLDITLAAIRTHGLRAVILAHHTDAHPKGPMSWCDEHRSPMRRCCKNYPGSRRVTTDEAEIHSFVKRGHNLGLIDLVALDFDVFSADIFRALGPVPFTAQGNPAKPGHCYFAATDAPLERQIVWNGKVIGEVIRSSASELVVCPPSIHPTTKKPYRWLRDPTEPLLPLPEAWLAYLTIKNVTTTNRPAFIPSNPIGIPKWLNEWEGPSAQEIVQRALAMPGARARRDGGVKFACAGCRAEGRDKTGDNAKVFVTGKWACARVKDRSHNQAIAESLGMKHHDKRSIVENPYAAAYEVEGEIINEIDWIDQEIVEEPTGDDPGDEL